MIKVFDTYKSSQKFEEFIDISTKIPEGRIVIAAVKDDC